MRLSQKYFQDNIILIQQVNQENPTELENINVIVFDQQDKSFISSLT